MSGAALALGWEVVARHRWINGLGTLYLLIGSAVVACLPDPWRSPELGAWLSSPLLILAGAVVNAASFGERADLRAARSGFPQRLFTLPVSSFVLASVPFLMGGVLLVLLWFAALWGLLIPNHADGWRVLPALAITAAMAWLQALCWAPLPFPWLRMFLLPGGCFSLLYGPFVAVIYDVSDTLVSWLLVGVTASCYLTALAGVRLARRGVGAGEPVRLAQGDIRRGQLLVAPFATPLRAQLWLEWRYLGWVSLWLTLILALFAVPLVHMVDFAFRRPFMLHALGPLAERMGSGWVAASVLLIVPAAFCMIGGDVSRRSSHGKEGMSPFFATRAISNPGIVQAKLLMTAVFVVVLWGELLAAALGWAAVRGHLADMMRRLGDLAGIPAQGWAVLAAGVAACCIANWLWLAGNLWVGLSGRPWVSAAMILVNFSLWVAVALAIKGWRPEWYPWLVGGVVAALAWKAVAVIWVCRTLLARRYATPRKLAAVVLCWGVLAAAPASLASWAFPGGWLTFAAVLLLLPLATALLAPVALAWDRHR